ncbi:TPA: hypothetical protein HA270_02780 [Candidatus Woesearchaeota archaeon]|nr:hypothetical protein [Candidatus Woesearchaeota archaeon]
MAPSQASGSSLPIPGLSLLIVHAGKKNDTNGDVCEACRGPIQELVDRNLCERVYEHQAYHHSYISHSGTIIDNEECPGAYPSEAIYGNEFIVVGGGLGYCHLRTSESLIRTRYGKSLPTKLHLPADCIYTAYVECEEGNSALASQASTITQVEFTRYLEPLLALGIKYLIGNDMDIHNPSRDVIVSIWSSKDLMLEQILARKYPC